MFYTRGIILIFFKKVIIQRSTLGLRGSKHTGNLNSSSSVSMTNCVTQGAHKLLRSPGIARGESEAPAGVGPPPALPLHRPRSTAWLTRGCPQPWPRPHHGKSNSCYMDELAGEQAREESQLGHLNWVRCGDGGGRSSNSACLGIGAPTEVLPYVWQKCPCALCLHTPSSCFIKKGAERDAKEKCRKAQLGHTQISVAYHSTSTLPLGELLPPAPRPLQR